MKELRNRYLKNDFEEEGYEQYEESDIRKDRFQLLTDRFTQNAKLWYVNWVTEVDLCMQIGQVVCKLGYRGRFGYADWPSSM